jgi:hypothetical protein
MMNRRTAFMLTSVALVSLVTFPQTRFAQSSSLLETWKQNIEKSKYNPGPALRTVAMTYQQRQTERTLYRLSQTAAPPQQQVTPPDSDLAYAKRKIIPWESPHCDAPRLDFPRWTGFPVTLCDYRDIGVTVRTYMLNANDAKQARWTVTACRDARATKIHACIDYLVGVVRGASSGGIFPVAGYVPEPQNGGRCYLFRDGVTVYTTLPARSPSPKDHSCGKFDENEPLAEVGIFARIASTTRDEYTAAGGTMRVDGLHWVDVVRTLYQTAWMSDRNELISATAMQARREHRF